ncbi:hypothetical protein PSZ95_24705, partial [Shigella sonnei]|nr:hypothetical protein [Shigella sonnei]
LGYRSNKQMHACISTGKIPVHSLIAALLFHVPKVLDDQSDKISRDLGESQFLLLHSGVNTIYLLELL